MHPEIEFFLLKDLPDGSYQVDLAGFLARFARRAVGGQEVTVVVSGGYRPDVVVAKKGVPLRITFDRREDNPCSDEVVLPEFKIRRRLPAFAKTEVTVVPERTGDFPFSCGMNMLHGMIRVVD